MEHFPITESGSTSFKKGPGNKRHSNEQKAKLEELFNRNLHPDDQTTEQISKELGLEPKQVKVWFQNKRTQHKYKRDRRSNESLRKENEKIKSENLQLKDYLKIAFCSSCSGQEPHVLQLSLQNLKMENANLLGEHERLTNLLRCNGYVSGPMQQAAAAASFGQQITMPMPMAPLMVDQNIPTQDCYVPTLPPPIHQHTPLVDLTVDEAPINIPAVDYQQTLPPIVPNYNQNAPSSSSLNPSAALASHPSVDYQQTLPPVVPYNQNAPSCSSLNPLSATLASHPTVEYQQTLPPVVPYNQNALSSSSLNSAATIPSTVALASHPTVDYHQQTLPPVVPNNHQNVPTSSSQLDPAAHPTVDQDIAKLMREEDFVALKTDPYGEDERTRMSKIVKVAFNELEQLLAKDEPLWFKSLVDGKFTLDYDNYQMLFEKKASHQQESCARVESSKESRVVNLDALYLVDVFLNSDKWVEFFPTIVRKAKTVQVLDSGFAGGLHGAKQLIKAEMHMVSPLLPTRELFFLRYCKQLSFSSWVIMDVSVDSFKHGWHKSLSRAWRLPSGCLISQAGNRISQVTWVEHVEVLVEDIQSNPVLRDFGCDYGAERWVLALERMSDKIERISIDHIPSCDYGVISAEGRKSVLQLTHRMVKIFCETMDMSSGGTLDGRVKVSIRNSPESTGLLNTTTCTSFIVTAATSFSIPLPPHTVFAYFKDITTRIQWDDNVRFYGSPAEEIQRISNSQTHPHNYVSIIQPSNPTNNSLLVLQETCSDPLGSMLVYAPMDMGVMNLTMKGQDTWSIPILPSGITILNAGGSGGSLLTLAFHDLQTSPSSTNGILTTELHSSVASITALVTSTVHKIKAALNCSTME